MWQRIVSHRSERGVLCVAVFLALLPTWAGGATPTINVTYVSPYGSSGPVRGSVSGVNPSDYAVAVYINVPLYGWWTKPSFASPLTLIQADGTWTCRIVTGGQDAYATEVAAFLVPHTYSPPAAGGLSCLPPALYAFPYAQAVRYQALDFANGAWRIKVAHDAVGPGPNYFSDSGQNVWVDANGRLHLKVMQEAGHWYCSEVIADQSLGYGRYSFTVTSGIAGLNQNVVLGFFTWQDCVPEYHYREIDVEVSRWGAASSPNTQFVVQPWDTAGNRHRFEVNPACDPSGATTHEFTWEPGEVQFRSYYGGFALNPSAGSIIESWPYTGGDLPPAGGESLHINLWLMNGQPPTDGLASEVVIGHVTYLPYEPDNVYRFWSPVNSRHFYTTSESERDKLITNYPHIWTYEGVAYSALAAGGRASLAPVYRFWSASLLAHFYTTSESERDKLITNYPDVWTYERIAFYAYAAGQQPPGTTPVYRFWSDRLGCHFYTTDETEKDKLITTYSHIWTYEGIAWHAYWLP